MGLAATIHPILGDELRARICSGMHAATHWLTEDTIPGRPKLTSAITTSSTRSATPSCRRRDSRILAGLRSLGQFKKGAPCIRCYSKPIIKTQVSQLHGFRRSFEPRTEVGDNCATNGGKGFISAALDAAPGRRLLLANRALRD